jgi:hypothetical protein
VHDLVVCLLVAESGAQLCRGASGAVPEVARGSCEAVAQLVTQVNASIPQQ